MLNIVMEGVAKRRDSLVNGLIASDGIRPKRAQHVFDGHNLVGSLSQINQDIHRLRCKPHLFVCLGQAAVRWIYLPLTNLIDDLSAPELAGGGNQYCRLLMEMPIPCPIPRFKGDKFYSQGIETTRSAALFAGDSHLLSLLIGS
jgi:hypothetical protein